MADQYGDSCTPDKCGTCPGCGGMAIEKITIRVEWKHKGAIPEKPEEIEAIIHDLSGELMVSGVELIYINNTFGSDITDNSSAFMINGHPLQTLVEIPSTEPVSKELLRKAIFQALLKNL